jgi:hypothetical protein
LLAWALRSRKKKVWSRWYRPLRGSPADQCRPQTQRLDYQN